MDVDTKPINPNHTATLLVFNTVERLLRGDFFHTVSTDEISEALTRFPKDWPLLGVGTTNWYRRNGEAIVEGYLHKPKIMWADPLGDKPMMVINIAEEHPSPNKGKLITPTVEGNDDQPQFPFLAMAACNPETKRVWKPSTKVNLHEWLEVKLIEENIGLAGVRVEGIIYDVEFTAAYHLPLGGLDLSNGYTLEDNFKFGQSSQGQWRLSGVYAVNPTLQNMISVEGLPLHFHGYDPESRYGGHITQALVLSETVISVWPLKDLLVQIKNLDRAWLPVRELGE